jgi:hypothetical protein
MRMRIKFILICYLSFFIFKSGNTQVIFERHTNEVYFYLSTMAQKGIIELDDLIMPLSKDALINALLNIKKSESKLTKIEKAELQFYLNQLQDQDLFKFQKVKTDDFTLRVSPIFSGGYSTGEHISFKKRSVGINLWGTAGKKWAYQFSFQDVIEKGLGLDSGGFNLMYGSNTGKMLFRDPNQTNYQNFSELRAHISYSFKKGYISVGQDYLNWGYGENGKLVLSDKAPTYPYIRFHYQPTDWLNFDYTHAWLQSAVVDSNLSYGIPTNIFDFRREVFIKKYMATHSLSFRLKQGVQFSLGESILYNDQLQPGYLLPIMFFKAYDNIINRSAIQSGSNGQFFFQLNARNQWLPKSHFYSTLFIDEIRLSSIFNPTGSRNQLGYNIGLSLTDFILPYLKVGVEYTRVRPFVYRNFLPAQNYTHHQFLLGEWIGANADKWIAYVKYTPVPRMKLQLRYQTVRKGEEGTLWQQYFEKPQMKSLSSTITNFSEFNSSVSYQLLSRCIINLQYAHLNTSNSAGSVVIQYGF